MLCHCTRPRVGDGGGQVMHPTSRTRGGEKRPHPTHRHNFHSQSPFRLCHRALSIYLSISDAVHGHGSLQTCPGALVSSAGGVSSLPISCQIQQMGWKGEQGCTSRSAAKPCTEDGFELRGCVLPWRHNSKDMLYVVQSARNLW